MRVASIQLFGDYLCGVNPPYLVYNGHRRVFESCIEVDDVEGGSTVPRLKLAAVQEQAFLASLAQFKRRLAELGIESGDDDEADEKDEKDKEEEEGNDGAKPKEKSSAKKERKKRILKKKLSSGSGQQLDENEDGEGEGDDEEEKNEDNEDDEEVDEEEEEEEEEDDEFRDEWEAIEEMNQLGVCSVERRKLLQYRQLVKNCPQSARYFKLMEVIEQLMVISGARSFT